ncbi:hypothetical protein [Azospirillum isscasi]|uniref:Uncharacterized protein n=1 Tax=Azospirillum isscasi TaxID=3053926 RepID=A0ABU0WMQ7_9PROT|nr:hypothetical protein [Azospirillum isscasi]MDQ2105526.1 hypothetical protein [Azospirillum isscasi]
MVIARTLGGRPSYDLRLIDGTIVKYAQETDCEVLPPDAGIAAPVHADGHAGGHPVDRPAAG